MTGPARTAGDMPAFNIVRTGGGNPSAPLLTLAPGQTTKTSIGRYATSAELVPVYDAFIAAGVIPDIRVDGSASGGAIPWDDSITLDPTTVISGRSVAPTVTPVITVRDGVVFFPGTLDAVTLVSASASPIGTVSVAGGRDLILRNGARLRSDGTGVTGSPMFRVSHAAGVLNIRMYDTSSLDTGAGPSASTVAGLTVAGATVNVHGCDAAVVQNDVFTAVAATVIGYKKYSDGVSFSTTQSASAVAPTVTLLPVATQINYTTAGNTVETQLDNSRNQKPTVTYAPGQAAVPGGVKFSSWANAKAAFDALVAAGYVPDLLVDSSAGTATTTSSLTVPAGSVLRGRYKGSGDVLNIGDTFTLPGFTTVDALGIISKSSVAVDTLGATTRDIILRNSASLRNDGTGAASAPMIDVANAAAVLNVHAFDDSTLKTGSGGTADVVAKASVAGAALNIHGYDTAIVQATTLAAIAATTVQYHKHSAGVSFSTTQAGVLVTPAETLYSTATQITATLGGGGTSTVQQTLTGLPRLIWRLDPTISVASQLETTLDTPGATALSFVANPAEPTNITVLSIAMNAAIGEVILRIKDPTTGSVITLPNRYMFTALFGYRNAANNNQVGPLYLYGDNTHFLVDRLATALGAGVLACSVYNNTAYQSRASNITTLATRAVGAFWWSRLAQRVWMVPSTGALVPEFLAEMGGLDAAGLLNSSPVVWDRVTNLGAGWTAFTAGAGGGAGQGWGQANGCRTGGFWAFNDTANATTVYIADARFYELPDPG